MEESIKYRAKNMKLSVVGLSLVVTKFCTFQLQFTRSNVNYSEPTGSIISASNTHRRRINGHQRFVHCEIVLKLIDESAVLKFCAKSYANHACLLF